MKTQSPAASLMIELAEHYFIYGELFRHKWEKDKPGAAFEALPEGQKETLRTLTSGDLNDVRWPPWR